jgi:hypothetical protein
MSKFLALLFLVSACSTSKPTIIPPSETIDPTHSRVQVFQADDHYPQQRYFLNVRNEKKQKIDIDEKLISVNAKFNVRHISTGRYQLFFDKELKSLSKTKFLVQGFPLKKEIQQKINYEPIQGNVVLVQKADHELTMRLKLENKQGKSLEPSNSPDILLEGGGHIYDIKRLQKGLWEFKVGLPEENQIIYINVRANGAQLDRLFRYQHVEN